MKRSKKTKQQTVRGQHAQEVVTVLRCQGEASRAELARLCDVSRPTAAAALAELAELGLVEPTTSIVSGGRPATHYGFCPSPGLVVAVDVLHASASITACRFDGRIVASRVVPLTGLGSEGRFSQLTDELRALLGRCTVEHGRLLAMGVSTTGIVDSDGRVLRSDLVPQWNGFPLSTRLAQSFDCPVRTENDINSAAYGEFATRVALQNTSPTEDILYINFFRGFHTGLILNGAIHRGHSWSAGEITDVFSSLRYDPSEQDLTAWGRMAAATIGPLCVVVDPGRVIASVPSENASPAIDAINEALARTRTPAAPPLTLETSLLGATAATIGAVHLALLEADVHLFGESSLPSGASPHRPPRLTGLELVRQAIRAGVHTTLARPTGSGKPLRVGVVGVGARARLALETESSSIPAEIVAACEPHRLARQRVRDQLRKDPEQLTITSTTTDLIRAGIDVAFVTSPDDTHAEIACELLEAGVAVYLEKPIAIHLADATRILNTAHRTGTKLYVGHNMRHMNFVRSMRSLIAAGRIGEPKAIWCRHFVGSGGDFYFKDWHASREHSNGLLLQKAAHDIDVMHWLADAHTTEVVGMGENQIYGQIQERVDRQDQLMRDWFSLDNWPPLSQRGLNPVIDVEDLSMMLMRMSSGVLASYQQCHFTPDYWRNYTVIGSEGRLENFGDDEGGVIRIWNRRTTYNPDGDEQFPILHGAGHTDADKLIVDEFLRFVVEDAPTDTSPLGAWYAVAAGIKATESLRDGSTPRTVPELDPALIEYFSSNQSRP